MPNALLAVLRPFFSFLSAQTASMVSDNTPLAGSYGADTSAATATEATSQGGAAPVEPVGKRPGAGAGNGPGNGPGNGAAGNGGAGHSATGNDEGHGGHGGKKLGLALAALGVVYGDIGTSPLYAVKECFHGQHAVSLMPANILGVLSLIFWSLIVVVSIKYVMFIMRADNKGEGGIFALLALVKPSVEGSDKRRHALLVTLALFGAALLYGDGIITPAVSVLSAMEGLDVATDAAGPFILPGTCFILILLFRAQKFGTAHIGKIFGPLMVLWFAVIAVLGVKAILLNPGVIAAVNPAYAVDFFVLNHLHGMVVLGSVVLCITGGEALYADMGHFGPGPIRLSWYVLVLPSLMLNYFGQGALLLERPEMAFNPFYALVPHELLYPMVALATMATVIASQAMISGVFSLTQQAVQLGFCPRVHIVNTSAETKGQIYLPDVNNAMMVACLGLVLAFKSSSALAGAYGIAVTATMGITSVLYFYVVHSLWRWPAWKTYPLLVLFLSFDITYLSANLLKILDGGWFTLTVAGLVMLAMMTWRDGKAALARHFQKMALPVEVFMKSLEHGSGPLRVSGTAVFMSVSRTGTPVTLLHYFKHSKVLHEQIVLLSVAAAETPFVAPADRLSVTPLGQGFFRVLARYGFMESPSVPEIARLARSHGLDMRMMSTSFFLGREILLTSGPSKMMGWRKSLFAYLSRNAWNATTFFNIPPGRVVELGSQVEL